MSGETDLAELLQSLDGRLCDDTYVFVTLAPEDVPSDLTPQMMFREAEGVTLILAREDAVAHGLSYQYPCEMITLKIHSSLDAVGFMAHIANELAAEGLSVNPVAGFFHDHIFVPAGRGRKALKILGEIRETARKIAGPRIRVSAPIL